MSIPAAPEGYATVNPFIITLNAEEEMRFVVEVFDGVERPEARTVDEDGLLFQGEVAVGTTTIMFAERKPDWPFTPSLLQVYVHDIEATLERALSRGAELITRPTDFFGTRFARIKDPGSNMWWIWQHGEMDWDEEANADAWDGDAPAESWGAMSPDLAYIRNTIVEALPKLKDPLA
jgi:uncharacterized glyoxalase superfamily protein PhnB